MLESLTKLFERDLDRLAQEISLYENEKDLWLKAEGINNSTGNLALHLVGNLNHFIGAILGKTSYVRNREAEFSDRDIPLNEIAERVSETKEMISRTLGKLNSELLEKPYPLEVFGQQMTTEFFLIHLQGHLNYHLGQINYHRRLLTGTN